MNKLLLTIVLLLILIIPSGAVAAPFAIDFFPPLEGTYVVFYPHGGMYKFKSQGAKMPDWFYNVGMMFRPAYIKNFDKGTKVFGATLFLPVIEYSKFQGANEMGIGDLTLAFVLWPFEKKGRTTHFACGGYASFPTATNDHFELDQYSVRPLLALAQSFGKFQIENEFQPQFHFGNDDDRIAILNDLVVSYGIRSKTFLGVHVNMAFDVDATKAKRRYVNVGASVRYLYSSKIHLGFRVMYPAYYDNTLNGIDFTGLIAWLIF